MSIIKHTEEKAKEAEPKTGPQPGPPTAVLAGSETEGELIIIRGQGPLLSEGVYGEGPIIETISAEEDRRRKVEAKKAEEEAKAEAEKAKAEARKAETHSKK